MVQTGIWGMPEQGWRKGPWTPEEDKLLHEYVRQHGEGRWSSVSKCSGLKRSGKSCRLRWVNYLRPGLKKGHLTPQEEGIIIELHALWGNKWSTTIAKYLPGRTDDEIKNYWSTHFKKRKTSGVKLDKRTQEESDSTNLTPSPQATKAASDGTIGNHETEIMTCSNMDGSHQLLPLFSNYDQVTISSWSDFNGVDNYLWNLDDQYGCNKIAIQNRPINAANYTCEGDAIANNYMETGGYIFLRKSETNNQVVCLTS